MTPLPVTPKVAVLIDAAGNPVAVASNIAPLAEMEVIVTTDVAKFDEEAKGKPFRDVAPVAA